jgi:hypothetical protein
LDQSDEAQVEQKPVSRKLDRQTLMVIGAFVAGLVLLIVFNMK